ncbi:uncharacterized protein MAM_01113 [Metarhizium album ARSEF 1941]|uniref:BTB/POZ fold protein n=1 Tax=Metarhizium album (strain ARSEF 1941) TaxID=1081103 RepID=A0A0B2X0P8_METAS|nr:uncharacterized protein MAM_01113 [Metarhizium album ARSEF 1941]KHO02112.1 hypothetical protein MAM_01113 [Metarhizium album ARSEF 1941]
MSQYHETIDLYGDVVVALTPATHPLAPWDQDLEEIQRVLAEDQSREYQPPDEQSPSPASDALQPESGPVGNDPAQGVHSDNPPPRQLRYLVSSKHLAVASVVFHKSFSGPWREGNHVHPDGLRHVRLVDFDPKALSIVLNVFHLKHHRVPKHIDADTMCKIALLVDYLDCHEAVASAAASWMPRQKTVYRDRREVVIWVFISSVFGHKAIFRESTRAAVVDGTGPFRTLGLPIQQTIVERIDAARIQLLNTCLASLDRLIAALRDDFQRCSFLCDSIMLGALIKNMNAHRLLRPRSEAILADLSVSKLKRIVETFKTPF